MTLTDTRIAALLTKHSLLSDQVTKPEISVILHALKSVEDKSIPGAIVEFGCFLGTTSVFIQRWQQLQSSIRPYHVYDSFEGLPSKLPQDASPAGFAFQAGELTAAKAHFVQNFKKAQLPLPVIHKGWFEAIVESDVPSPIAFAFLDGDYFSSIQSSLLVIESKLSPGAVIIIDDYLSTTLPGAKKAADAWMAQKNLSCMVREGMAIIQV